MRIRFLLVLSSLLISLIICISIRPDADLKFSVQKGYIDMYIDNLRKEPIANLDFRLVTDNTWKVPGNEPNDATKVNMHLIITNNTLSKVALYLLDTVSIEVKTNAGATIPMEGGRNGILKSVAPIGYIEPGKNLQISRSGSLSWATAYSILRLTGSDEFGGMWYFDDLHKGNYLIRVIYENTKHKVNGVRLWRGRVVTNSIGIRIG